MSFRYVEVLDKYFGSVCELDIIFNFEKAYYILDELILGGEMQVWRFKYFGSLNIWGVLSMRQARRLSSAT